MLVFIGVLLGLLSATISESFFHKFWGHPFEKMKALYFKNTKLFSACLKPYYQHYVIHHKKTYLKHFFSQFDSVEHKERVDKWIDHNFEDSFKKLIWIERYNLTLKGLSGTLPFAGPFCLGPLLIWIFLGGEAFLGSLLTAYIPVWMSKYIHPLVHAPEETKNHHPFIQWFMRTRYAEKVLLNHFLHHNDGDKNFNLFLGGDYLIGLHRNPTFQEQVDYEILLEEFREKVRLGTNHGLANEDKSLLHRREALCEEYTLSANPCTQSRYEFQKELMGLSQEVDQTEYDYENFGFSLYSKVVDYREWGEREEFQLSSYDSSSDEIISYRGNEFKTGDILLTNQASDADGLFSTLLERDINFAHVAVFINLTYEGKILPAVIEINEYGTRAVPLKAFLSKQFNSYVEIFRYHRNISSEQSKVLGQEAIKFLGEDHAFDIYQNRNQNYYLNCARTIELLFYRAGIELEIGDSRYHRLTEPNLYTLGIESSIGKDLLMPDDYALNSQFNLQGALANGTHLDMFARNLTRAYLQRVWRGHELNKKSFPLAERIKFHVIEQIQKNGFISKVILFFFGIRFKDFPSGPSTFISLISFADSQMIHAVQFVKFELEKNWESLYKDLSWNEILNHERMAVCLFGATSGFRIIFASELNEFVENSELRTENALQ